MNAVTAGMAASSSGLADQEATLWRAFKDDRSQKARERLFDLYYPLARSIARSQKFGRATHDFELPDLIQWACAGLLEALDAFDPSRAAPFKAFARRRIRGSVLDGISKASELREQISFRNRMRSERTRSLASSGLDDLSGEEAMKALIDLTVGLALGFMLEESGASASEATHDRRPTAYESLAWKQLIHRLAQSIGELPEREQGVVRHHYLNDLTFEQIGQILGLSKGRVSQIHKIALARLREQLRQTNTFRMET